MLWHQQARRGLLLSGQADSDMRAGERTRIWRRGSESNRRTRLCRPTEIVSEQIVTLHRHTSCHVRVRGRCVPTPATQIVTASLPATDRQRARRVGRRLDLHLQVDRRVGYGFVEGEAGRGVGRPDATRAALKACKPATLAGSLDALRQFAQLAATR